MKNSLKDRNEHKLKEFNKRLNSFCKNGVTFPEWENKRKELLKEYGFTDEDWCHLLKLLGQSKNGRKKHNTKAIGWKRAVKDRKENEEIKSALFEISPEQERLNETGEFEIRSDDYWLDEWSGDNYSDYLDYVEESLQNSVDKDE